MLGDWEIARLMIQASIGILQMDWHRVVQAGLNASGLQFAADAVSLRMQDDKEVPDMTPARGLGGQRERKSGKPCA